MMKQQIVFDLGAVVFRWEPLVLLQELFADKSPDETKAKAWASDIFMGFKPYSEWSLFDKGELDAAKVARQIADRTDFEISDIAKLIDAIPDHLQAVHPTIDLIETLRQQGHPLYFLSNMPAPFAKKLLERNNFNQWFIDGIFSCDVHRVKPEAPIFEIASSRWQLDAPIFIDDSQKNIDTANNLGWRGICFKSVAQTKTDLAHFGVHV